MANQRILYTEEMVGNGHPTKADTLNRHGSVEHLEDGTHGKAITQLTASKLVKADASKILAASAMAETAAGEVTNASQPAFAAFLSAQQDNVTGDNTAYTIVFDTEIFDQNADYNNATGVFTAPVTGRYNLNALVRLDQLAAGHTTHEYKIVTSNRTWSVTKTFASNPFTGDTVNISQDFDMDAADTAYVVVTIYAGAKVVDVVGGVTNPVTAFSGHLVC